jgi:PIN domain nuclease of toxin-antitoxin system
MSCFLDDSSRLNPDFREQLSSPTCTPVLSIASLWEINIKLILGKLELGMSFPEFVQILSGLVEPQHLVKLMELPFHHRDPFDRLIAAQALSEQMTLFTQDAAFRPYGLPVK